MAAQDPKPTPAAPAGKADAASNRFVQEGDEGMTFNGMSLDEFLAHPATKAALAKSKAPAAAPKKGDK